MEQIKVGQMVDAPKDKVWSILADFDGVYKSNPYVMKSYTLNEQSRGLGAERHCELNADGSSYSQERIVEWHEGEGYAIEMHGGTNLPPVNDLRVALQVEAIDEVRSRIFMIFNYCPKWGILGQMMNPIVFKPLLRPIAKNTLLGFKHHIETGQNVESTETLKSTTVTSAT